MTKKKEKTKGLFVDMPISIYNELQELANERYCSKRSLVLQALKAYLERGKK